MIRIFVMFGFCAGRDRKFGVSLGLCRVDAAWSRDLSCGIPYECGEYENRVDMGSERPACEICGYY